MPDPQKILADAFRNGNLSNFMHALEILNADPNYILDDDTNGYTLFQNVLMTPNSAEYIRVCIENGADCYSKTTDDRYPLHLVVESLCPKNLQQFLISDYDSSKVNVKKGDKNSLHMLINALNHSNYNNTTECIKILLNNGCNPNFPDESNQTPFSLLLEKQKSMSNLGEVVEYFIKNTDVDVYTYSQDKTIENFRNFNKKLQIPTQKVQNIDPKFMFSLAVNRKEIEFESYFKAFSESCINNQENYIEECGKLLEMATIKGAPNIVELILQHVNVDINTVNKGVTWKFPPSFIACKQGFHKILEIFLRQKNLKFCFEKPKEFPLEKNTNTTLLHEVCLRFGADRKNDDSVDFQKCFNLLINDTRCDISTVINSKDSYGCTPLHYSTRYKNEEATTELLKKSAYLCIPNNIDQLALDDINKETFENFLDDCIVPVTKRKKQTHLYVFGYDEQELHIDYSFLIPPKNSANCEISTLSKITKNKELRKLITHPVLFSFLHVKWSKLSLLFFINFIMFSLFLLSFIAYIVLCQYIDVKERRKSAAYMFFYGISIVFVIMLTIREILQCLFSVKHYFRSKMNWFEIILIALSFFVLFGFFEEDVQRILRGVTILFASTEFLILAGTLPNLSISTHMVILRTVILTFLKSISLYSILLFGFGLCFYTLFGYDPTFVNNNSTMVDDGGDKQSPNPSFYHPGIAIIKTFVMLTGEFEFGNLELHNYTNYFIFVLFVFLIAIVLFNLLNALAVSDTQVIKAQGQLVDLVQRISVLNKYEKVIFNGKSFLARWLEGTTNIFQHWIPTGKIVVFPNKNNEIMTLKRPVNSSKGLHDEEMQTLNNNNAGNSNLQKYESIVVNEWLPKKFQKGAIMDVKIMKAIKRVLEEKKNRIKQEENEIYRKKMDQKILQNIISIKLQHLNSNNSHNIDNELSSIKAHLNI